MGKIFFLMGKSCSGKDTFYKMLLNNSELNLKPVVGYTTRPLRENEENGREYNFVSREKLLELSDKKLVIECRNYNTVYGIWSYFTVDDGQIDLNGGNYIYIGTLESYKQMVLYYGREVVEPILIDVENGLRLERALEREKKQNIPKYEEMCRRFLADEKDFSKDNIESCQIYNTFENNLGLEQCYNKIVAHCKKII